MGARLAPLAARRLVAALLGWTLACAGLVAPARAAVFGDWAAVVVAGDWRAHSGAPSEVFDNARHDVTKALLQAGFAPDHVRQFSVRPERYPADRALKSQPEVITAALTDLTRQAPAGCLIYFTSHGSPEGLVMGDGLWLPGALGQMVDQVCGDRPTVAVVAACFSGVFVPALQGPNRMVLTAARPDRASFGCGEADHYTFFDTCFLQTLPHAASFAALGPAVQACVARREQDLGASPASEPQLDIGAALRPVLPLYAFKAPP